MIKNFFYQNNLFKRKVEEKTNLNEENNKILQKFVYFPLFSLEFI